LTPDLIPLWVKALSNGLRHQGTLTLIVPPRLLEQTIVAMREDGVPATCVFPVWPMAGRPARFILVQGRKNGRSSLALAAGLVLHTETGGFQPEADAILRGGEAIPLSGR